MCVCSSETDLVREIGIEYMEKVSSERRQGQYIMSRRQRQREKNEHLCVHFDRGSGTLSLFSQGCGDFLGNGDSPHIPKMKNDISSELLQD